MNDEGEIRTIASWYGPGFQGRKTASGERFDQNKMTAASRTLPFGTRLNVRNLSNGRSCTVVINDRGPYVRGRGIDLSHEAARRLGIGGIARVCYSPVPQYKPQPSDDSDLVASVPKSTNQGTFDSTDRMSATTSVSAPAIQEGSALIEQSDDSSDNQAIQSEAPAQESDQSASAPPAQFAPKAEHLAKASKPAHKSPATQVAIVHKTRRLAAPHDYRLASRNIGKAGTNYKHIGSKGNQQITIAAHNQRRSKHAQATYYVASAQRSHGPKMGRTIHGWSVKLAHICHGLKGILASL